MVQTSTLPANNVSTISQVLKQKPNNIKCINWLKKNNNTIQACIYAHTDRIFPTCMCEQNIKSAMSYKLIPA